MHICVNGELIGTHGQAVEWTYPHPRVTFYPQTGEVEKPPFQISANRLELDENVNRTHFKTHWLVVKWCNEQSYIFWQSPKWVNADWAQYMRSSSGLTINVVITLFFFLLWRCCLSLTDEVQSRALWLNVATLTSSCSEALTDWKAVAFVEWICLCTGLF